jgi:hypothetical protein
MARAGQCKLGKIGYDAARQKTMSSFETERERLSRQYAELSDAALAELAADAGSLTDTAREALRTELATRSLQVELAMPSNAANEQNQQRQISGPLVMVKRFRDMPEAQVAESILDSAGIDCFLADENTIRMDWLWSNLLGGFKLMVRPEDLDAAAQLLTAASASGSMDQADIAKDEGEENE